MKITQEKWDKLKGYIKEQQDWYEEEEHQACLRQSRSRGDYARGSLVVCKNVFAKIESLEKEER